MNLSVHANSLDSREMSMRQYPRFSSLSRITSRDISCLTSQTTAREKQYGRNAMPRIATTAVGSLRGKRWLLPLSLVFIGATAMCCGNEPGKTIQVVIWDEQQPSQKPVYPDFLGNHLADYLKTRPGLEVRSSKLDDPDQGLSRETLDWCDVLIYWDHARHQGR
jgi:hypothetical protein